MALQEGEGINGLVLSLVEAVQWQKAASEAARGNGTTSRGRQRPKRRGGGAQAQVKKKMVAKLGVVVDNKRTRGGGDG